MMTAEAGLEALFARMDRGDRSALAALHALTAPRLFPLALRIAGDSPAAEAALGRVYHAIWRGSAEQKALGLAPLTWLILLTRREALAARPPGGTPAEAAPAAPAAPGRRAAPELSDLGPAEPPAGSGRLARLDQDDPERAEALRRIWFDGAGPDDLAARLGRPAETIRPWLRAGLARLEGRGAP